MRILTENRKKIAVYCWVNKVNGNFYIGSSTNLHVRMYTYFSLRSLVPFLKRELTFRYGPWRDHPQRIAKSNRPIDRALLILKHGFSNFRLEILEYCSYEDVIKREQYFLDIYKPQYNIATIAGSTLALAST